MQLFVTQNQFSIC